MTTVPEGPDGSADRPFRRRVLRNTAATAAANGWAIAVGLISLPILLASLGSEAFGLWALLMTFSAVGGWCSLLDLGIGTAATREVATRHAIDDDDGTARAVGTALAIISLIAIVAGGAFALVAPAVLPQLFNAPDDLVTAMEQASLLFAAQLVADLITGGAQACLEGLQRVDLSRVLDIVRRTAVAVGTCAVAIATEDLVDVAVASLVAALGTTIISLVVLGRQLERRRPRLHGPTARALLGYGRTTAVLRPLGVLQRTMDRFIVGAILGPSAVTMLEIATQIQNASDAVLSAASYSVTPSSAWLTGRGDRHRLADLVLTGTRYALVVTLPVAALSIVLATPGVRVWLGPEYAEAGALASVAVLTIVAVAPLQVGSNMLLGTGHGADILIAAGTAIAVNLVVSVLLVHSIGTVGAPLGTLASALVTLPLLGRSVLRTIAVPSRRFLREAVLPTVPATLLTAGVAAIPVVLRLGDVMTIAAGTVLGVGVYLVTAPRFAMQPGETADLGRSLVGRA